MQIRSLLTLGVAVSLSGCAAHAAPPTSPLLIVDAFGYPASAACKIGFIADPQKGQNVGDHLAPGPRFELRTLNGKTVFSGDAKAWKNGQTDDSSGDKVWKCDFSAFSTPGRYVLFDPANNRQSAPFTLGAGVYDPVLRVAGRTFFYQRCGTSVDARHGGDWTHDPCHLADLKAPLRVGEGVNPQAPMRDVSGGWHDAGDYNKYVPFTSSVIWDLLAAYERQPRAFGDNWNIPESGDGVPDILNEVAWETKWLLKMQLPDGSVCNRAGQGSYDVGDGPDKDAQTRFYTAPTTWATATFIADCAHAARVFDKQPKLRAHARELRAASLKAWQWLGSKPAMFPENGTDGAKLAAAGADGNANSDRRARMFAGVELALLTGDRSFARPFETFYLDGDATQDGGYSPAKNGYVDASNAPELLRAAYDYTRVPGGDARLQSQIKELFRKTARETIGVPDRNEDDPYGAFMWSGHYCWGSNQLKATWAKIALLAADFETDPQLAANDRAIAGEYLHYLHGRNPLDLCYLTNMKALGAPRSPLEPYHGWFHDGSPLYDGASSKFGPAPGFLVGGPNGFFTVKTLAPPANEPPQKAYRDWNSAWNKAGGFNENSWEVTEPAIYYQASYIFLASAFCDGGAEG